MGLTLRPGDRVADYTVVDDIAGGGFSRVYRVRDDQGRPWAMKVPHVPDGVRLHTPQTGSGRLAGSNTQRLVWQQDEIEALAKLDHGGVVRLRDFGVVDPVGFYIVMELVDGPNLEDYCIERGPLDPLEALQIAHRLAEAVAHCHQHDVLHRDLKPSNIVLTDPHVPSLKILDFGLAHLDLVSRPAGRGFAGTLDYSAPEMLRRERPPPDPAMDLYAIGVILFRMIAGSVPQRRKDTEVLITGPAPRLSSRVHGVPRDLDDLVASLLEVDPSQRFSGAGRLRDRLLELYFAILGDETPQTTDPTPHTWTTGETPYIGRNEEQSLLVRWLAEERTGSGRAVVVMGRGGVGKSRLVAEVVRHEQRLGAVVGHGRFRQAGGLVAYLAVREALSHLIRDVARSSAHRQAVVEALSAEAGILTELVPELAKIHTPDEDLSNLILDAPKRVARGVRALLEHLGRVGLVVLAFDDMQWMDRATHDLLMELLDAGLPPGVEIVGTSRPDDRMRRSGIRLLEVGSLGEADNRSLLASLTGGDGALIDQLIERVPYLAAGNPLFAIHVVRELQVEGLLVRYPDGSVRLADRIAHFQPPGSVDDIFVRTIADLPESTRRVLGVGALLGSPFRIADLERIVGSAPARAAIAAGQARHLCRTAGEVCVLTHGTAAEHLTSGLPEAEIADLHRRIAELWVERGADPADLALHLEGSGQPIAAATAYHQAGVNADRAHDPRTGIHHLDRAIELLLDVAPSGDRDAILVRAVHDLARIGCLAGETEGPLQRLGQATTTLPDDKPLDQQMALDASFARVLYARGAFPLAVQHAMRVLNVETTDPALVGFKNAPANIIGRALTATGKVQMAIRPLSAGCKFATASRDWLELCHSQGILSVALSYMARYEEAENAVRKTMEIVDRLGDPVRYLGTCFYWAILAEARYDYKLGIEWTTRLLRKAEADKTGGLYLYLGTLFGGRHQYHVGRIQRGRVMMANALNMASTFGIRMGVGWGQAFLADAYFVLGELDKAREWYTRAVQTGSEGAGDEYAAPMGLVGLAHCDAFEGADPALVFDGGTEGVERLIAAGNHSAATHALQRLKESLLHVGHVGAEEVGRRHAEAVAARGVPVADWWPEIPPELQSQWRRSFWLRHGDAPVVNGRGQPVSTIVPGTFTLSGDTTTELIEKLSRVEGFMPEFS